MVYSAGRWKSDVSKVCSAIHRCFVVFRIIAWHLTGSTLDLLCHWDALCCQVGIRTEQIIVDGVYHHILLVNRVNIIHIITIRLVIVFIDYLLASKLKHKLIISAQDFISTLCRWTIWISGKHVIFSLDDRVLLLRVVSISTCGCRAIRKLLVEHDASFVSFSVLLSLNDFFKIGVHFDWFGRT